MLLFKIEPATVIDRFFVTQDNTFLEKRLGAPLDIHR